MMLVIRASGMILLSAIGIRTLGFHRTRSRVESLGQRKQRAAAECVRAIRRARRLSPFGGNCLSQSLALLWLLRRAGHEGEIKIGVKPADGRMLAHAWVELDGEVIDPAAIADQYVSFASLP